MLSTRSAKRLTLISLLLLLAGCTTKIAYHYLDFAMVWTIEKYVGLTSPQKTQLEDDLEAFHIWHRTTQLPLYADYLDGLKARLNQGTVTPTQMHAEVDQLQVYLDGSLAKLMPSIVTLAASLSDEQVDELLDSIAKDREKYRKEYVDVSEEALHKARVDELKSHLNLAIRRFTSEQKDSMFVWSQDLVPYESMTLRQQEIWGEELAEVLAQRADRAALDKGLRKLFFVHTDHWDPKLEAIVDQNQTKTYHFLANLLNSLSAKQQQRLNDRLDRYSEDFREMAVALD